jgi:short subunit dehydrogenase-like uncharacterized protein
MTRRAMAHFSTKDHIMSSPSSAASPHDRALDVVLWGATGFAGKLVAEYFAKISSERPIKWAIAGRTRSKLEVLLKDLLRDFPELIEPELIVAESFDRDSLVEMAKQTRVICSTVGPYAKYGNELVSVCVQEDTDYCDLTGETHWVRKMIDAHHEQANEQGTRIVHFCGFDSIPSDMGTLMLQEHAITTHGTPCEEVRYFLTDVSGGFSGGTAASMINMFEEGTKDREVFRSAGHPYGLNPRDDRKGPKQLSDLRYGYDEFIDAWVGPFVMASVNTRVVRRSNALLGHRWGKDLLYSEAMRVKKGVKGAVGSTALAGGFMAFGASMALKPTRKLLKKFVLPEPGEGPSRDKIENGYFAVTLVGKARDKTITGKVYGERDPGYGATALMLGESALCLARMREELDANPHTLKGGVLTPASAMGTVLLEQLKEAGMTFEITSV